MFSAKLKFKGYNVEKLNYMRNTDNISNKSEEIGFSPEVLFKLVLKKGNKSKANIIIGVRLGFTDNDLPFKVEAVIRGYFEFGSQEEASDKELYKYYLQNGSAILYPYLRTIITNLTGAGNYQAIILPTVNFYNLIQNVNIEELLLPSDIYEELEEIS